MVADCKHGEKMVTVLIRHTVADYDKWKAVYDELKPTVKSMGVKNQRLLKNSENPRELVVLSEVDDAGKAHEFAHSDTLKKAMQRAGVSGEPTMFFLEEVENKVL